MSALGAYRAFAGALEPLAPVLLRARARRGKEEPARLPERLGHASGPRPPGRLAWLHGASVGEGLSLLSLAEALAGADPELQLLLTSGTTTAAELIGRRLQPRARHQFLPIDGPRAAARFAAHWRPELAVFAESELWPNLIAAVRKEGARTALVSARLSASSLKGWARVPRAAHTLLGGFDLVLPQDEATAAGLVRLGARDDGRLNLKLVAAPLPADASALAETQAQLGGRPLLLAASTHSGEEREILDVFGFLKARPEHPLLVLVPRHPARGEAVAALARQAGARTAQRAAAEPLTDSIEVYVADTLGELGLWFRLARVALVGGSLVEGVGGHNPLEPLRLGCPVVSGPHVENWREVYRALEAAGGVRQIGSILGLAPVLAEALIEPGALQAEAARGRAYAEGQSGAVEAAARRLLALTSA